MITTVVLTKNEERNILNCLKSLKWCEEIIVIDDNSQDRTIELINSLRNKKIYIFKNSLNDDFSRQRNFGLSKAKKEWVLFVDADERVSKSLKNEIIDLTTQSDRIKQLNGYFIKRIDFMWGKELKYGETGDIKLLRLAKRDSGKWERKVHEKWKVKGATGELKNPMLHYPHQTISEFLRKINFYAELRSRELYEENTRVHYLSIISYPLGKFVMNYFIKGGFKDGVKGAIIAILMSLHSFLVRAKLWLLWTY